MGKVSCLILLLALTLSNESTFHPKFNSFALTENTIIFHIPTHRTYSADIRDAVEITRSHMRITCPLYSFSQTRFLVAMGYAYLTCVSNNHSTEVKERDGLPE